MILEGNGVNKLANLEFKNRKPLDGPEDVIAKDIVFNSPFTMTIYI